MSALVPIQPVAAVPFSTSHVKDDIRAEKGLSLSQSPRKRRIRPGSFRRLLGSSVIVNIPRLASYRPDIPSQDGKLIVPRVYIPSTYDTTVEVTTEFNICYKIYRPDALKFSKKAPLVVLHGGPSIPSNYLFPLVDYIEDRSIIFFDQIGCGKSSSPTDIRAYSIENAVDDLEKLVRHLNLHRFHLYGHSYGGIVAYEYIKRIAERNSHTQSELSKCVSITLSSTPSNILKVEEDVNVLLHNYGKDSKTAEVLLQRKHVCRAEDLPEVLLDAYAGKGSVWEGTDCIAHYVATPPLASASKMPPLLLTRGESDFVSERYGAEEWEKIYNHDNIRCVTLEGCSHHGLLENGPIYGQTMNSFLNKNDIIGHIRKQ